MVYTISLLCKKICLLVVLHTCLLYAPTLLMIEGVSGAGKSTLSRLLVDQLPEAGIIPEPFERWNSNAWSRLPDTPYVDNLFETFLHDQTRWGLTFQNFVFVTHYQALEDAYLLTPTKDVFITDRSHLSGIFTFTRMLFENKKLTPTEWAIYQETAFWFVDHLPYKPDGFIYLRTQPTTACNRANKRNRSLNASLNLPYYETLHRYHEEWLLEKKNVPTSLRTIPVLILDGELDFESDAHIQQDFIKRIRAFITMLSAQYRS